MSERSAESIINNMLLISKKIESMAVKLNWRASRADTEQEPIKEQLTKWAAYRNSNFVQAEDYLLMHFKGEDKAVNLDNISADEYAGIHRIALYFFAINEDINPAQAGGIGDKERAALAAMLDKSLKVQHNTKGMVLETAVEKALQIESTSAVPHLFGAVPQSHLIANNKLSNNIAGILQRGETGIDLIVSKQGKKEITSLSVLTYEGNSEKVQLTGRQPYTEYDRNVNNAAASLYAQGVTAFTPAMLYRAMVNLTDAESPSKEQIAEVEQSLDKQRFIRARIDCTDELNQRGITFDGRKITSGKVDTYLLAMRKIEVEAGGQRVEAYKMMEQSIIYDYSSLIGQVLTVPASLLSITEGGQRVRNTKQRIAIKGYLLRRIEVMKGKTGERQSRHIMFDTVYEMIGEADATRQGKERTRKYIFTVLDYWQDQGYIKGYSRLNQGKAITGVEIILD